MEDKYSDTFERLIRDFRERLFPKLTPLRLLRVMLSATPRQARAGGGRRRSDRRTGVRRGRPEPLVRRQPRRHGGAELLHGLQVMKGIEYLSRVERHVLVHHHIAEAG